ncbi:MAG: alpha/beta hydrolase [Desulfobacteraceae bacterium]|nr:alpha/beta hydrolase [Desulfobacteraceae bacterium]
MILVFTAVLGIAEDKNTRVWSPRKVDTSHIKRKWTDIPYAAISEAQKLDIYLPDEENGPFPVVMYIHGGAFMLGDKTTPSLKMVLNGLNRGYAVVSVNYRLSGEAVWPACVLDVKAAVRWLRANAKQYKLNPEKIAVWGTSAGGHLAAMLGTSGGIPEFTDSRLGNTEQPDHVQAVADWFGPINFLTMTEQFRQSGISDTDTSAADSPESKLMGRKITEIPGKVRKANPETYITPDDPPFFILHGIADKLIPVQQSEEFAAKLRQVLGKEKVFLERVEGLGHGALRAGTSENTRKTFEFLDKNLK